MADETSVAEQLRPGVSKKEMREKVREVTGPRHRKLYVDESTWDYLVDLKEIFGLDNLRQTAALLRELSVYGTQKRREEIEGG